MEREGRWGRGREGEGGRGRQARAHTHWHAHGRHTTRSRAPLARARARRAPDVRGTCLWAPAAPGQVNQVLNQVSDCKIAIAALVL